MGRKFFVVGNWKMNGNKAFIDKMTQDLTKNQTGSDRIGSDRIGPDRTGPDRTGLRRLK